MKTEKVSWRRWRQIFQATYIDFQRHVRLARLGAIYCTRADFEAHIESFQEQPPIKILKPWDE